MGTAIDLCSAICWETLLQSSLEAVALSDRPRFIPSTELLYKQIRTARSVTKEKGSSASMAESDSIKKSVDNHKVVTGWAQKMRGIKRKVSVEQFSEETSLKFRRLEKGNKVMGTKKTVELSFDD